MDEYPTWLIKRLRAPRVFESLLGFLHSVEFLYSIRGDENRVADGLELREEYISEFGPVQDLPCDRVSVLEVLAALSIRCAYQTDSGDHEWFWIFISNLGLGEYRSLRSAQESEVRGIVEVFLNREYDRNGVGGIFPLDHNSRYNQKRRELYAQFFDYLNALEGR